MTAPASPMFTNDEVQRLILALGYSRRAKGFTEAELETVVQWAEHTRMNQGLLENVLDGSAVVDVQDGEVVFGMTPKGNAEAEAMIAKARG